MVAADTRIAIVEAGWHADIVTQASNTAADALTAAGVATVDRYEVPGAFEIPLFASRLAETNEFDAIIACGLVVDGGIYAHEYVADAVISGLMLVQLEANVPIFSCVLTPQHFHEHGDHVGFFTEHMVKKGAEVAATCLATLEAFDLIPGA